MADSSLPARPISDRALDAAIALRALREQFPDHVLDQVRPLPAGWASDPYVADDRLVAHFPRNAEIAEWTDWSQALLEFVQVHLGSWMAVPQVLGRGKPGDYFPYEFLVARFIPGIPLDDSAARGSEHLPEDLGVALTHIHEVPTAEAAEAGVTQPDWDEYEGELSFLHGDFGPPNIIVDPGTGRMAGVIDWGNAALGDRARDFHRLVLELGWEFTHQVLDAYSLPVDEGFLRRLRQCAQEEAAQWLLDSVRRGLDPERNLRWVRNAFSIGGAF
jgi:aminoglycoside phosphotransferase (APT) family kinase protein